MTSSVRRRTYMLLQIKRIRGKFEPIVSFNNIFSLTFILFVFHMTLT